MAGLQGGHRTLLTRVRRQNETRAGNPLKWVRSVRRC